MHLGDRRRDDPGCDHHHAGPGRGPGRSVSRLSWHMVPPLLQRPPSVLRLWALLPQRIGPYPLGTALAARKPLLLSNRQPPRLGAGFFAFMQILLRTHAAQTR